MDAPPFRLAVKARGREGTFHIFISTIVVAIAACSGILPAISEAKVPWFVYGFIFAVGGVGCWFLARAIIDLWRNREWELCADTDRLTWIARDRLSERVEGEIYLRDIRALIYRADGDCCAYLEVEFIDGAVKPLPLVGAPSDALLLEFINYWRVAHAEIPIRNLEDS